VLLFHCPTAARRYKSRKKRCLKPGQRFSASYGPGFALLAGLGPMFFDIAKRRNDLPPEIRTNLK